jgi:hypothetical protein
MPTIYFIRYILSNMFLPLLPSGLNAGAGFCSRIAMAMRRCGAGSQRFEGP